MMKHHRYFLIFLIAVFIFLRTYHLVENLNFGTDQGIFLMEIFKIYQTKKVSLIGPTASLSFDGRYVFLGSFMYYLLLPILMWSKWNPLSASYFIIFFQLGAFIYLYLTMQRVFKKQHTAFIFAILFTFATLTIDYSRFIWNPNFLLPISCLLISLLLDITYGQRQRVLKLLFLGIVMGIGMQFHLTFALVVIISCIWLIVIHQFKSSSLVYLILGFMIGFLPIIIFELRHNFYNLQTVFFVLTATGKSNSMLTFQPHYFLAIVPFIMLGLSVFIERLSKKKMFLVIIFLFFYILNSLSKILVPPENGFTMVKGWNYHGIRKTADIILSQNVNNFNLIDVLTGDTRAMALRSLLTVANRNPLAINDYQNAQVIYLYTNLPIELVLKFDIWEIKTASPLEVTNKWLLQNDIYLYRLDKHFF